MCYGVFVHRDSSEPEPGDGILRHLRWKLEPQALDFALRCRERCSRGQSGHDRPGVVGVLIQKTPISPPDQLEWARNGSPDVYVRGNPRIWRQTQAEALRHHTDDLGGTSVQANDGSHYPRVRPE